MKLKDISCDVKTLWLVMLLMFVILLPAIFVPVEYVRITAAVLLCAAATAVCVLIRKRRIHSFNQRQVFILLAVIAAVYLSLSYISGLYFGYLSNYPLFSVRTLLMHILPGAVIIVTTEIIRSVILAHKGSAVSGFAFVLCVVSDLLLGEGVSLIGEMHRFMDIVGLTLLPAITSNLLYHYISKRYGAAPNIAYRLILSLTSCFLPVVPDVPEALQSLSLVLLPLVVWLFIDLLYENKFKRATKRTSILTYVGTGLTLAVMVSIVMLITCQFRFGLIVIATPSMQGELNIGDAVVYETFDEQIIQEGDIIIYSKTEDVMIVHRVVDIQRINGQTRYFTKGDANEDLDYGYVTESELQGVVLGKVPYIGHPSLWLRGLFT